MDESPPESAGPDDRGDPLDGGVHGLSDAGEKGAVSKKGEEDRDGRDWREV